MSPVRRYALVLPMLWAWPACVTAPEVHPYNSRRVEVLEKFFTPEAAAVLDKVPLRVGRLHHAAGFAVGDDLGSRMVSFFSGFGNRRQVIISQDSPAEDMLILHEYVHQADYFGLIDKSLFRERYAILCQDIHFRDIAEGWERRIVRYHASGGFGYGLLALAYDHGLERELIAYLIQGWVEEMYELPEYMLEVYVGVIRPDARERR